MIRPVVDDLHKYEGRMLWPYAEDIPLAVVESRWPDAVVMMDSQCDDMLHGDVVRFVETDGRLRLVVSDPRRALRSNIPSSSAHWKPEHQVWIRYTTHTRSKPGERRRKR